MGFNKKTENTMINSGFYIVDASVKYLNAKNPLEERLIYSGDGNWTRNWGAAFNYSNPQHAVEQAKDLQKDSPVKVLHIQNNGNSIGYGEIQF